MTHYSNIWHITPILDTLLQYLTHYSNTWHITPILDILLQYLTHYSNTWHITPILDTLLQYLTYYSNTWHITSILDTLLQYLTHYSNTCLGDSTRQAVTMWECRDATDDAIPAARYGVTPLRNLLVDSERNDHQSQKEIRHRQRSYYPIRQRLQLSGCIHRYKYHEVTCWQWEWHGKLTAEI